MTYVSTIALFFVMVVAMVIFPAISFAAEWGEDPRQRDGEGYWEWDEEGDREPSQREAVDGVAHNYSTGIVVGAQTLGFCATSFGLSLLSVPLAFLFLFALNEGGLSETALVFAVGGLFLATPFAYALTTNEIGKWMGRGSHYWWTLGGTFLGSALFLGLNFAVAYWQSPIAELVTIPGFLLPLAGSIGGYHLGHRISLQRPSSGLSLQPVKTAPEWGATPSINGATLNLGISF